MAPLLDPPGHEWEAKRKASDAARIEAVHGIRQTLDIDGVMALARAVKIPAFVGMALAEIADDAIIGPILVQGLHSGDDVEWNLAHGIIMARERQRKGAWSNAILDAAVEERWSDEAIGKLLLSLPNNKHFIDRVSRIGGKAEEFYWRRVRPFFFEADATLVSHAIDRLLAVGRGPDAIRVAGHHTGNLSSPILVRALHEGVQANPPKEDHNSTVMYQHSVEEILNKLDRAKDVELQEIARLEWIYLPGARVFAAAAQGPPADAGDELRIFCRGPIDHLSIGKGARARGCAQRRATRAAGEDRQPSVHAPALLAPNPRDNRRRDRRSRTRTVGQEGKATLRRGRPPKYWRSKDWRGACPLPRRSRWYLAMRGRARPDRDYPQ